MRPVARCAVLAELRALGWTTRVVTLRDGSLSRGASRIDPDTGQRMRVVLDVLARGRHVVHSAGPRGERVLLRASTEAVMRAARSIERHRG